MGIPAETIRDRMKPFTRSNSRVYSRVHEAGRDEDPVEAAFREIGLFVEHQAIGTDSIVGQLPKHLDGVAALCPAKGKTRTADLRNGQACRIELGDCDLLPRGLTIENLSDARLDRASITIGELETDSLDAIAASFVPSSAAEDRTRALDLLLAFRAHVEHAPKQAETNDDPLSENPVALLRYFGQSTCGVLARGFATIAAAAGLRARVWRNELHTFAEVWFDGAWHLLDPDPSAAPFYPAENDARRLLSVEDLWTCDEQVILRVKEPRRQLERRPDERAKFRRLSADARRQRRARAFCTQKGATVVAEGEALLARFRAQPALPDAMTLMPRERIELRWNEPGPWYAASMPLSVPPKHGAVMLREFRLDADAIRAAGRRLDLDGVYPILDVVVDTFDADRRTEPMTLSMGRRRVQVEPVRTFSNGMTRYRARRALQDVTPWDGVSLAVDGALLGDRVRILTICLVSPRLMRDWGGGGPRVRAHWTQVAGDDAGIRVTLRGKKPRPRPEISVPLEPAPGAVLDAPPTQLAWSGEAPRYRAQVCRDPECRHPVSANLDRTTIGARLELDDDDRSMFERGNYYWRVGSVNDDDDAPVYWSEPVAFEVH